MIRNIQKRKWKALLDPHKKLQWHQKHVSLLWRGFFKFFKFKHFFNLKMRQLQNSFKTQNIKLIDSEQEQDSQSSSTFDMDDGEKA